MPNRITNKQRKILKTAIKQAETEILHIYEQSILEISITASTVKLKPKPFSLSLYPVLERQIEAQVNKIQPKIYNTIIKAIKNAWKISNNGNDQIVDKRLAGKVIKSAKAKQILYDPNKPAMNAFLDRKEKGLNLSQRVWNLTKPYKYEMEQALGVGLSKGQSAARLATEMKKFLNEPNKLFRKVQSEDGRQVLSQAARAYNPGRGVYRSSYKNALRLTATETNMAYRTADFERWKGMPFVIGIRVVVSENHPTFDICDTLAGLYPKEFKWVGWHPWCRCHAEPEMMNDADYNKLEDDLLAGKQISTPKHLLVSKPPASFVKYLSDNKKRIAGFKNKPYWVRDNKKFVS